MHFHKLLLEGPVADGMAVFIQGPGFVQSTSILINVMAVYFDFHGGELLGLIAPVHSARRLLIRRQVGVDFIQGEVAILATRQQGLCPGKEAIDGFRFQMFFEGLSKRFLVVEHAVQARFIEGGNGLIFALAIL